MNGWSWKDAFFLGCGLAAAVFLALNGSAASLLETARAYELVGAFVAGLFFVSVFTAAPAVVVFVEIIIAGAPLWPAVGFAGLGAMCGDLIIFLFIKNNLADRVSALVGTRAGARIKALFRFRLFRWLSMLLGALVIASPLPDEVGLALLGFSKIKKRFLLPLSFVLNAAGLLVIALAAKAIG